MGEKGSTAGLWLPAIACVVVELTRVVESKLRFAYARPRMLRATTTRRETRHPYPPISSSVERVRAFADPRGLLCF